MTEYIIVLDLNRQSVDAYPVPEGIWNSEDCQSLIAQKGHHLSECSWMGPSVLKLQIHNDE